MNEYSFSITKGKGNQRHNNRTQLIMPAHVDKERIKDNIIIIDKDIRKAYKEIFAKALEEYNAKQKRNDRKIKDYYQKIAHSKKEKTFQELVVQIGSVHTQAPPDDISIQIYKDFVKEFQKANPQMEVIGAYIHMDETSPHLHLDYVPYVEGAKKGLKRKISNNGAIKQMGYNSWLEWREAQFELFRGVTRRFDIDRWNLDTHEKHRSTSEYKAFQHELAEIKQEVRDLDSKHHHLWLDCQKLRNEHDDLEKSIEKRKNEEILRKNEIFHLEKKKTELEQANIQLQEHVDSLNSSKLALESDLEQKRVEYHHYQKKNLLFRLIDKFEDIFESVIEFIYQDWYDEFSDGLKEQFDEVYEDMDLEKDEFSL